MPFTKIANAERRLLAAAVVEKHLSSRGWCQTKVPVSVLGELSIPYEVVEAPMRMRGSQYIPDRNLVYAPAWVCSIERRTPERTRLEVVKQKLAATRDDPREQEQVSMELLLDSHATRAMREAAHVYRYKRAD